MGLILTIKCFIGGLVNNIHYSISIMYSNIQGLTSKELCSQCVTNAECKLNMQTFDVYCACKEGFSGDPLVSCTGKYT